MVEQPPGRPPISVWPGPALAALDLPIALRERLLRGLLWLCAATLRQRRDGRPGAAHDEALWQLEESRLAACAEADLSWQTTIWITWLLHAELRQALRVLLAGASAFHPIGWRAAILRQTTITEHLDRALRLYHEIERRSDEAEALLALDEALAALAEE